MGTEKRRRKTCFTCKTNFYRFAHIRLKFSESMEDISYSTQSMFWGVVLKPEKRYEQAVEDPFHISKACLEPTSVKDGKSSITSVYIEVDDEEFLLCNLSDKVLNESLDLNFNTGDKLVFKTSGPGVIHLTGYNVEVPDEDDEFDYDGESEGESEEESVDEAPQLVNGKKRKMNDSISDVPNKKKDNKLSPLDKLLADAKKVKPGTKKEEADDDDLLDGEAEEGDEDEEDEDGEEEEEESEDEEMETDAKPKINGSPKKQMNGDAKKATPEKSPQSTPESGDKKKKKKNKKKNKNKDTATPTEAGDAKTPAKDQPKVKPDQKTPAKAEQKTPGKDAK